VEVSGDQGAISISSEQCTVSSRGRSGSAEGAVSFLLYFLTFLTFLTEKSDFGNH
jgi:hypothetical protein